MSQLSLDGRPSDESGRAVVIHGASLSNFTDEEWENVLSTDEAVFARATPEDKVRIVQRLQKAGYIVTSTGDGCNDAPALRAANAGVAMGCAGSNVSRAATDVDDDEERRRARDFDHAHASREQTTTTLTKTTTMSMFKLKLTLMLTLYHRCG